jgi:hypothetical protein
VLILSLADISKNSSVITPAVQRLPYHTGSRNAESGEWHRGFIYCHDFPSLESCDTESETEDGILTRLHMASTSGKMYEFELANTSQQQPVLQPSPCEAQKRGIQRDFDVKHGLDGNSEIRMWGVAVNDSYVVACMTMHPSDMIDYVTPKAEQTTLIFGRRVDASDINPQHILDHEEQRRKRLARTLLARWILEHSMQKEHFSAVERSIVGAAAIYLLLDEPDGSSIDFSNAALTHLARSTGSNNIDVDVEEARSAGMDVAAETSPFVQGTVYERCGICAHPINFQDAGIARCNSGHEYSELYPRYYFTCYKCIDDYSPM